MYIICMCVCVYTHIWIHICVCIYICVCVSMYMCVFLCICVYPMWLSGKESTCHCRRPMRYEFHLWIGKIPWRRKWQSTPVFFPAESHGQRRLVGCSLLDCKELDMTKHACIMCYIHMYTHTHLKDIIGSVLDHCNKANIAIKRITQISWFLVEYKIMFILFCSPLSVQ